MPRAAKPKADAPKKAAAGKKKNGYVMPESIPLDEVLTDLSKKQWKIGPSIGVGGFGEIYSATSAENKSKKVDDYEYVVKIEPHGNGPLFVEMHFYMRNAKLDEIKKFMKDKGLKSLGMPYLIGSGSHDVNGQKHRFIVMPRYGRDIWSFFLENGKKLPEHTIYRLALQMIDVYEYIHGCTYVHADLKGANILLGFGKGGGAHSYLVDYGLASHYTTKDFKPDPKKMHNGTIEYTSRDAHKGVPTMRGDFEILGYNLVHWSGVTLPWEAEKLLTNPAKVQKSKETFMEDVATSLNILFKKNVPNSIKQFLTYVASLEYNETPDYEKCRSWFSTALKSLGKAHSGDLDFKLKSTKDMSSKSPAKSKRHVQSSDEDEIENSDAEESDVFQKKEPPKRTKKTEPAPKSKRHVQPPDATSKATDSSALQKEEKTKRTKKAEKLKETEKKSPKNKANSIPDSPAASTRSKLNTPNLNLNFSPVVSLGRGSGRKPGKTVINDGLTPNAKSSKTYEFNFELDVSMDANVIVNVKRKKKASETDAAKSSDTPVTRVKVRKLESGGSSEQTTPRSKNSSK